MKSIIRFGIVAVVVALLISAIGVPVRAQGTPPNPCFDLKADDCKIITDGMAALAKVTSTNFSWGLSVKSEGTPESGTLDVTGKGSTVVPPSTGAAPSTTGNPMASAIGALATVQFQTTIESKGMMGTQDMGLSLELRITGNTLYIMGDKLTGGKWMALKLDELMTSAMGMMSGMMSGGAVPGMPGGSSSGVSALATDPELLNAIMQIPNIPGVIKVTRDADQDATDKSEKYAQFTYTLDLVTLVKAKEFLPIVKAIAAQAMASRAGGAATPGATPVQLTDEQAAQFVTMIADALKDVKIQAMVAVGLDSKTTRGLAFSFSGTFDPKNAMLASMMTGIASDKPVSLSLSVFIEFSSLNKGDAIVVPAGAQTVTIAQLMSGMMGGGESATPAK